MKNPNSYRLFRAGTLLLALGMATSSLLAQEPRLPEAQPTAVDYPVSPIKAEVAGYIRYAQSKQGADSVLVRLETNTGTLLAQTWTNNSGRFEFPRVACGYYVVAVDVPGYKPIRVPVEHSYASFDEVLYLVPEENGSRTAEASVPHRQLLIPQQARKEYEKAQEALSKQKVNESIAHFRKAIEIYPEFEDAYTQLGLIHLQQRAYGEAQQALEKVTQVNPKNARAFALLGLVYREEGQAERSIQALKEAVKLDGNAWQAHLELGKTLLLTGKYEEAYEYARRAHQLHPQAATVHFLLYNVHVLRHDFQAALSELNELLEQYPENPWVPQLRERREILRKSLGLVP